MEHIGEIIESSTVGFRAESYELHHPPAYGSLVRTVSEGETDYGVVYRSTTSSLDAGRRAIARGRDAASPAEVYQAHPELEHLLHTEFYVLTLGFLEGSVLEVTIPPRPPYLHAFVYQCADEEVRRLSDNLGFLVRLMSAPVDGADDLIVATLRYVAQYRPDGPDFLVRAGKVLALWLIHEPVRLNTLLEKVKP